MAARRPDPASSSRRPQQPGRRGAARPSARRRRGRRALAWLGGLFVAGLVLGVAGFATAYALVEVPDPNELADAQTSTVYYSDGTTPIGTFSEVNRQDVDIEQVPEVVQHAVLSAEDRSFYENRGVSPSGIARALWSNLSEGTQQGGSTITQQYVKNYYLSAEQTYTRKAKEFFLALKIDQQQTKAETLEDYLNTVYFGRGAYGIQAAAQEYFGVDVEQLDASQGALLAAVLKAPSNYDPHNDAEAAAQRVDYVLDGMVEEGWLTAEERAAAGLPETVEDTDDNELAGPEGYLLDTVKRELVSTVGLTEAEVERGGLSIVTTFDAQAQAAAVEAVQDRLPEELPEGFHAALSAIDPATGGVVAMYAGADYLERQRNAVTQDTAQAGSTFKPFTLVAALEEGTSLRSTYSGASPMTVDDWKVSNFGGRSYGRINLLTATANSVNTVYAQLNEEVGPEATRDVAIRAGYPQGTAGLADQDTTISNVLGTASPHPIDVTQAYATFAAQGVRTQWHTIVNVTDADGTRSYTASPAQERVFSEDVVADATYAMQQVVQQGSGRYARNLGRPAAGKTGTSSSNKSAWFAGYTPQLAASVALYQSGPDGEAQSLDLGGGEVTGGSYPVRIWTDFMEGALEGTEEQDFPDPAYVGSSRGSSSSSSRGSSSSSTSTRSSSPTATPTESATSTATASPTDDASPTGTPTSTSSATSTSRPSGTATATSRPTGSTRPTATTTATGGGGDEDEEEAASTGAAGEAAGTGRTAAPSAAGAAG
ncbi:penicillin-binding protein [Paenibacillus sp. TRM 82003]|uniref:transglycosylase domain-containing protein n=1 Tax=Kineococcus sp. TRM81007 TaxID=2925831 RepID=UPI001F5ABD95|nr:transglycosylase domain-containing protein [Kineococcus sp. TRM81007]MCI2236949.1 penicillin-binding protein [Kineococcus sp. TRM81007]MCI3926394.1 penicillin-binding protein [Paenibacillus sp. TRM 82003]